MNTASTTAEMIRTAIDSYPSGICIAAASGRVILANTKMNELCTQITGHMIMNAVSIWKELEQFHKNSACEKLIRPWITEEISENPEDKNVRRLFFSFKNDEIWRFRFQYLDENTIQIGAAEITDLYRHSEEIYENNLRLRRMQGRQKALLKNIVEINENKEILTAKMKIHDEFGECLIATSKAVSEGNLESNAKALKEKWKRTLMDFSNIPIVHSDRHTAMRAELMQVSEMIGCRVIFTGEEPESECAQRLLYAAVREALTNAMEHAQATELYVKIDERPVYLHAEISDNGDAGQKDSGIFVQEGNGLTALRSKLEQEGAFMQVIYRNGVVLIVDIPK